MNWQLLSADLVRAIHDKVLNPGELTGEARDKSLDSALARVEHRLAYGLIANVFDLAAMYAMAVAVGHCFNDGNKRTAHQVMDVCLDLNGVPIAWETEAVGRMIVALAQGQIDAADLGAWLRGLAQA